MQQHIIQFVIIAAVILFAMYRRVRRTVGVQPLRRSRLMWRVGIFGIVGVIFLVVSVLHPVRLLADFGGMLVGGIMAFYAIKHCVIEQSDGGWTYETHKWINLTVVAVFILRIVYKLYTTYELTSTLEKMTPAQKAAMQQSANMSYVNDPWTRAVFFFIIAYYIGFYGYLLLQHKKLTSQAANN